MGSLGPHDGYMLRLFGAHINQAFGHVPYHVGSSLAEKATLTRYVNYGILVARLGLVDVDEGGMSRYAHVMGSTSGRKTIHSSRDASAPTTRLLGDPDEWTLMASYDLDSGERYAP